MAARTIYVWDATSVSLNPRSGVTRPGLTLLTAGHLALAFDAAADEVVDLECVAPQGITAPLTLVIEGCMLSATSGTVGVRAAVEAITPGDALNLNTTRSFDTLNYATSATVPGTAYYLFSVSVTLTNNDGVAAGDQLSIEVGRDADATGSTDSAVGDWLVTRIELRDNGG